MIKAKKIRYALSLFFLIPCLIFLILFIILIEEGGHTFTEINLFRMFTIISFSIYFNTLLFLVNLRSYIVLFKFVFSISFILWIIFVFLNLFKLKTVVDFIDIYYRVVKLIMFSILGPGLILYTIYYIKNHSSKIKKYATFGSFSLHEGVVGIVFTIVAIILIIYRTTLIPHGYRKIETVVIIAFTQIFILLFLFFGGLLIFRDYKDVFQLKFIRKESKFYQQQEEKEGKDESFRITKNDIEFFNIIKIMLFPIGFILCSISINSMIYGNDFLPYFIFRLKDEEIIILGFILCFIAGALIGIDWMRLLKIFYPESFNQIKIALNNLNSKPNN